MGILVRERTIAMHLGANSKSDHSLWSYPLDANGLVLYFGINGHRFLFNGHKGIFYDSLPAHAVATLDAAAAASGLGATSARSPKRKYDPRCEGILQDLRMFRDGTHPDLAPEKRQLHFCQPMQPSIFNIYVAQACNLSCHYCLNQHGTFGKAPSLMSLETARAIVSFIAKTVVAEIHQKVTVILFGGEPLLSCGPLYVLVRGLQDLNRMNLKTKVHLVLCTNGTIYDNEIFQVLSERPDCNTVVVSLDAFQHAHDRNRPFLDPSRGSTFDAVVSNLQRMMREQVPYSVTCVVPHPYDFVGAAKTLHAMGVQRLEIKQLIQYVYGTSELPEVFADDFELWKQNYLLYNDFYLDHLKLENPVRHNDRFAILSEYSLALSGGEDFGTTLACGVADTKVSIAADGRVMACEGFLGTDEFDIGHVTTGFDPAKYGRFEEWILSQGQLRLEHPRCSNCHAKLVCGGGCYAVSYDKTGSVEPPSESSCRFTREKLIIDLYCISRARKEHPALMPELSGGPS